MTRLWLQRLRQRKLVQWAIAYVAFAFALLQGVDIVAQRFGWPDQLERILILALAIGFLVAIVLAWYHGERGIQGISSTEIVILALLLALGGGLLWRFARVSTATGNAKIVTVPGSTTGSPDTAPQNPGATSPANPIAAIPAKSIAVLPFANESGKPEEQFFSDGLSEDLINALSQFDGLKVISRSSAFQFRNSSESSTVIGEKLGVAHLLEGAVQRLGDELRITATLVNAADGSVLWSQRYDKPSKDLFVLQDAITQAVANALKAKLPNKPGEVLQSDRPPNGHLDAYLAYQRGVGTALNSESSVHDAIDAFNEAIRFDPDYAAAYAQLSIEWVSLAIEFESGSAKAVHAIAEGRKAAATALALDPNSSLAHQARAYLLQQADMDWNGAEAEAQRALQLAPSYPTAQFGLGQASASLGRNRQAVELTRKALASSPRFADWYNYLAVYLTALDQLDDARKSIQTAIDIQPSAATYYEQITVIEILRGDADAALAAARKEPEGPWHDVATALALQIGRDRAAADAALQKLADEHKNDAPYQIAQVYALRRDPENVFRWLDRAWSGRDPGVSSLLSDPLILRYQNDPRFAAFCRKARLPTSTDARAMP